MTRSSGLTGLWYPALVLCKPLPFAEMWFYAQDPPPSMPMSGSGREQRSDGRISASQAHSIVCLTLSPFRPELTYFCCLPAHQRSFRNSLLQGLAPWGNRPRSINLTRVPSLTSWTSSCPPSLAPLPPTSPRSAWGNSSWSTADSVTLLTPARSSHFDNNLRILANHQQGSMSCTHANSESLAEKDSHKQSRSQADDPDLSLYFLLNLFNCQGSGFWWLTWTFNLCLLTLTFSLYKFNSVLTIVPLQTTPSRFSSSAWLPASSPPGIQLCAHFLRCAPLSCVQGLQTPFHLKV